METKRFLRAMPLVGITAGALLMSGCIWYFDITVENPCTQDLRVETFNEPPSTIGYSPPNRAVTVPGMSRLKIEEAYRDIDPDDWSLRIVDWGAIPVDRDHPEITLPSDACR